MIQKENREHTSFAQQKKGFRIHLIVFLSSIPLLWIIWYLTNRMYLWPLWSSAAWGMGILFHYLGVFFFHKSSRNRDAY